MLIFVGLGNQMAITPNQSISKRLTKTESSLAGKLWLTDNWYAALVAYESKTLNTSQNNEREKQLLNEQKPTGEHTNCYRLFFLFFNQIKINHAQNSIKKVGYKNLKKSK